MHDVFDTRGFNQTLDVGDLGGDGGGRGSDLVVLGQVGCFRDFFFFFSPEGIGVVERQTGMRQKSATQWVGVGMEVILVDRRSLDRGGL